MKNLFLVFFFISQTVFAQLFEGEIGIQAYTFRELFKESPEKAFNTMQAMGFKEIEGGGYGLSPTEFKEMASERGMKVVSFGASFEDLEKNPEQVAQNANEIGAKYVMCPWIPHKKGKFNNANAQKAIKVFNNAGKVLKESGITLTYHPHGYEFWPFHNLTLLDLIIQKTDPEYVSFEMDIFWVWFGGGDPVHYLNKYPTRWKLMHLKDMKYGTKKDLTGGTSTDNDVELGTGEINIKGVLKAAKNTSIEHYFIEDESSRIMTQVPASIEYIKNLK